MKINEVFDDRGYETIIASTPDTCSLCFLDMKHDQPLQLFIKAQVKRGNHDLARDELYHQAAVWHRRHREEADRIMEKVWAKR